MRHDDEPAPFADDETLERLLARCLSDLRGLDLPDPVDGLPETPFDARWE